MKMLGKKASVLMLVIEGRLGLPIGEWVFAANYHEASCVEATLEWGMRFMHKPKHLLGDKAYSSGPLTKRLWKRWHITLTAPAKRHYVNAFHDGRHLRRGRRRWKAERAFAWLKSRKRIETRYDYYPENYLGFVRLAACCILMTHLFYG